MRRVHRGQETFNGAIEHIYRPTGKAEGDIPLLQFAQSVFGDSIPYDQIPLQDQSQLPKIISLLFDAEAADQWVTVATIVGVLGRSEHHRDLVRFVDSPPASADKECTFRARTAALLALGYLATRHNAVEILDHLKNRTGVATWRLASDRADPKAAGDLRYLREAALLGLALSGRAEAAAFLISDARVVKELSPGPFSMETHKRVNRVGLAGYYARP